MKRPTIRWIIQKHVMVAGKGKALAVKEEHEEPVHRESELLGPLRLTTTDLAQIRRLPKYNDLCIDVFFRSLCENQADGSVVFVDTMLSKVLLGGVSQQRRHHLLAKWSQRVLRSFVAGKTIKILFPWHADGHWQLGVMVLEQPVMGAVRLVQMRIWESFGSTCNEMDRQLRRYAISHLQVSKESVKKVSTFYPVPQSPNHHQRDGVSCGPAMCLYAEREAKNPCVVPAVWHLKPRPNETCEQVFANLILHIRQQIDLVVQGCITADNMPMAKCNPALVAWYKSQADVEEFCKLEDICIDLTEMDSDDEELVPYDQIQLTTNAVRTPPQWKGVEKRDAKKEYQRAAQARRDAGSTSGDACSTHTQSLPGSSSTQPPPQTRSCSPVLQPRSHVHMRTAKETEQGPVFNERICPALVEEVLGMLRGRLETSATKTAREATQAQIKMMEPASGLAGDLVCFKVVSGNDMLAVAAMHVVETTGSDVSYMAFEVLPQWQCKGIGLRLDQHCHDWVRDSTAAMQMKVTLTSCINAAGRWWTQSRVGFVWDAIAGKDSTADSGPSDYDLSRDSHHQLLSVSRPVLRDDPESGARRRQSARAAKHAAKPTPTAARAQPAAAATFPQAAGKAQAAESAEGKPAGAKSSQAKPAGALPWAFNMFSRCIDNAFAAGATPEDVTPKEEQEPEGYNMFSDVPLEDNTATFDATENNQEHLTKDDYNPPELDGLPDWTEHIHDYSKVPVSELLDEEMRTRMRQMEEIAFRLQYPDAYPISIERIADVTARTYAKRRLRFVYLRLWLP
jgi:hypothetical protein